MHMTHVFPEFAEGTPQEKPSIDFPVIVISRWDNKTISPTQPVQGC